MSAYATKEDVQEIVDKAIDKAVTDLSEIIGSFAQQVDSRFNQLEAKVANIDTRLEHVEKRISDLEQRFDHLLNTIDGFIARIDRYETEQLMRDNQFNRLLAWARKVSEKTGIPLENL
ncbi:MAG TPA: hypothetical protein VJP80_04560 [Candidatus Saccharimonadales bacterium]|nr:hypothetical protein [Candidatus Saccharimonadales bacterium]